MCTEIRSGVKNIPAERLEVSVKENHAYLKVFSKIHGHFIREKERFCMSLKKFALPQPGSRP